RAHRLASPAPAPAADRGHLRFRAGYWAARAAIMAVVALGGFGTASCGGSEQAVDRGSSPGKRPVGSTDAQGTGNVSTTTPPSVPDTGEPENVDYFFQRLKTGDCAGVAEES